MSEASPDDPWKRCFLALAPDAASRDALAALDVPLNARRVPYEQLHLTVAFIGQLPRETGAMLAERLQSDAFTIPPASVTKIECWPSRMHPRLMVAVLEMSEAFAGLNRRVRSLMEEAGLPLDARAFRPHITLARFARDAQETALARDGIPALPPLNFTSLVLYSSTLARQGARYDALASVALKRA